MEKVKNSALTKADAAKLVRRQVAKKDDAGNVIMDKDHNPVGVEAKVKEEEVMAFNEYDDQIVVVTTSGEKLSCLKSSEIYKAWAKK